MLTSRRILLAAAVAVPLGVFTLAGWLNYRQVEGEVTRQARHNAAALAEHAQRTLRAHELIIEFVDQHVAGWTWKQIVASEELHRLLARLVAGSEDVSSIFLLDPGGTTFLSSRRFPMPAFDASGRDYFRELRSRDALYVSRLARGRLDGDRFFSIARRRSAPEGRFDGLIAVSVDPAYFEAFYATMLAGIPGSSIGLLRADGVVLARSPALAVEDAELPRDSPFFTQLGMTPIAGHFTTRSRTDGVERVFAYQRVGGYPVYASFNLATGALWQAWRRAMVPYALACLLALGLLLAAAALFTQRAQRAAAEAGRREAEEASRAKDRFLAALSHELRNPLAAIANASEVLMRSPPAEKGARGAAEAIRRQIAQLRRMLDDLLDTARAVYDKLSLERRRVDLRELAATVAADHRARPGMPATIELEGAPAWVDGDPVRLTQMLDNLLDNAVKYGGRTVRVRVAAAEGQVELAIEDDGRGIAPDLLPRLFQPFVQGEQPLDRAQGGLGLGLALVARLAALHGGSLAVTSDGVDRGSCFTLRLPQAEPPARLAGAAPGASAARKRRFVIVDDQADARESLGLLLRMEGHEVRTAAEGTAGLDALAEFAPDVALIDIGLPGIDGYEMARRARRSHSDKALTLVAVTGYGQPEDRERAREAGFDLHLTKPFSYEDLMRSLEAVGRRAAA